MFDHIVLVIIFLNCITIAMERPKIEPHSAVSKLYHFPINVAALLCWVYVGLLSIFVLSIGFFYQQKVELRGHEKE